MSANEELEQARKDAQWRKVCVAIDAEEVRLLGRKLDHARQSLAESQERAERADAKLAALENDHAQ